MHPYILHFGSIFLPTFGFLAAIGLIAALFLSLRTAAKLDLSPDKLWNAGLFSILSAFIVSRLLLVLTNLRSFFAYPLLLLTVPSLTAIGLFLTAMATFFYLRLRGLPILRSLDAWAPCATLAWVFLALGHFAEGSDPGLPTTLPWGLAIPPDTAPRLHPVPLYAAVVAALITISLYRYLSSARIPGETAASALAAVGIAQFLLTFFRQPNPYAVPLGTVLDPIQWISLGMIVGAGIISFQSRKLVSHAV